jgi:hypothetical protein
VKKWILHTRLTWEFWRLVRYGARSSQCSSLPQCVKMHHRAQIAEQQLAERPVHLDGSE